MFRKIFLLFVPLFISPVFAFSAVTVSQNLDPVSSCTVSYKTVSFTSVSGDDLIVVTTGAHVPAGTVDFNGDSFTLATSSADGYGNMYYLVNPDVGTYNLTVNVSAGWGCIELTATSFQGVDTGSVPTAITNKALGLTSSVHELVDVGAVGDYVIVGAHGQSGNMITAGTDFTMLSATVGAGVMGVFQGITSASNSTTWYANWTSTSQVYRFMALAVRPESSGGGGISFYSSTSTVFVPATLYSSQLFEDMATTTTYGFTSTVASTTQKQAGVIFITHATSSSPTITWGGDSMNFIDATDELSGYRTSLFILNYPDSASPVVVSGIASGTVKYLYQSVWSNADVHSYADKEKVVFGTEDASLSIPSPDVPATLVGSMFTMSGLAGFDLLAGSAVRASATSSTGDMSITSATCNAQLDDCLVGYTRPWSFVTVRDGVLVGISLSATTTFTYSSSSPSDFFGEYGTNAGFTRCLNEGIVGGISCVFKNLLFWTLSLIVPTSSDIVDLQNKIYSTLGSDNSVASAIFLIPINLALFTSTTTAPTSTPLTIAFPRSNGTYPVYSVVPVHTSAWAVAVDNSIASILTWILGFVSLIFVGKLFIRLFHI